MWFWNILISFFSENERDWTTLSQLILVKFTFSSEEQNNVHLIHSCLSRYWLFCIINKYFEKCMTRKILKMSQIIFADFKTFLKFLPASLLFFENWGSSIPETESFDGFNILTFLAQKRIQNLVKYLRWAFCKYRPNSGSLFSQNALSKCLPWFWIHFFSNITI